jgi:retron-type reverse transcriptase
MTAMDPLSDVPAWLLRPLPANAVTDVALHLRIAELGQKLPLRLLELNVLLDSIKAFREYDAAANLASAYVWRALDRLPSSEWLGQGSWLLRFARDHLFGVARARILRRLAKDPNTVVRRRVRKLLEKERLPEVALPLKPDGDWSPTGWFQGTTSGPLTRHAQGRRILARHGLPDVANLAALRKLLDIRSARQLGYFLLATDQDDGPYTKFTIPKRDGTEREICAPKPQLRWVQRQILDKILAKVPVHDAAHGFIPGRSIVTNALPHKGAQLLVKFDLTDFFPTIHYYRVLGLFASLGYYVGDARFGSADDNTHTAPTLARLCCYTPAPGTWGNALLPQGAPASPAISNLVCRRLDARLEGLAQRNGGVYTRYADDLTFSFRDDSVNLGRFRWWVDQVCHQEGFFVNQQKFRVIRASQRQVVTGIVVNDELRVPRRERRRFRAILHNCRKHGVESQARGRPQFTAYLRGYASYIHMVDPEEGAELLQQVEDLLGPETADEEEAS